MTTQTETPDLAALEFIPYLDQAGQIPEDFQGKVGVYAIFNQEQALQFVGYSRDVYLSLKQHLVRQPAACDWIKVKTIDKPSRIILESIREAWIAENGNIPIGNGEAEIKWTQPIDVKGMMTPEEQEKYQKSAGQELEQIKVLKKVARRVESEILSTLESRGVKTELRFNPKLKENGLLDLK